MNIENTQLQEDITYLNNTVHRQIEDANFKTFPWHPEKIAAPIWHQVAQMPNLRFAAYLWSRDYSNWGRF